LFQANDEKYYERLTFVKLVISISPFPHKLNGFSVQFFHLQ